MVSRDSQYRSYCFGFICFALFFATKCDRRIVLGDLYQATPSNVPSFRQLAAYPFDRAGNIRPEYVLTESDQVQIDWNAAARQGHRITVNTYSCSGAGCNPCPASGIQANRFLIEALHPRLPLAVLGRVNGIEIIDTDASEVVASILLCGTDQEFLLDRSKQITWADVVEPFKANQEITVSLVSSPARRALPGDLINITLEWQFKSGESAESPHPYAVAQVQSTIDSFGRSLVPGLSSPSLRDQRLAELRASGLKREWLSDLDRRAYEIPIWRPGLPHSQQMSLQRISACLSALWSRADLAAQIPTSLREEIVKCSANGIESSHYMDSVTTLGENNHKVRYQIEVDQSWKLVIGEGYVYQRTFSPGETISKGVLLALREIFGREFHPDRRDKVFVVVLPREELGPQESAPFWAEVNSRLSGPLDSIYIAPGDTVLLSDKKPKLWVPKP
jgi:hypothetical protein